MDFDNPNWSRLLGGHRLPYDSKRALQALDQGGDREAAWDELWSELHHQGDVGEASYAAVPYLVRIHIARGIADWNTYALVATIDECRREGHNPALPYGWRDEYEQAMVRLAEHGLVEIKLTEDLNLSRSIIAVVAIWKHLFVLARLATASMRTASGHLSSKWKTPAFGCEYGRHKAAIAFKKPRPGARPDSAWNGVEFF